MKRIVLSLFVFGLIVFGVELIMPGFPPLTPMVQAATEDTFTLDVAIDCNTWRFNQGIAFTAFGRGDSFLASGKIFPGGYLDRVDQSKFDPNAPGSIGTFWQHGTMAFTGAEIAAGARPAFLATWVHLLNGRSGTLKGGSGIVAAGPHPEWAPDVPGPMAVVGGMGDYSGVNGEVLVTIIGTNSTGCPNVRSTFHLKKEPQNG